MAEIPIYREQGALPSQSGAPRTPFSFGEQPLAKGAKELSDTLAQGVGVAAYMQRLQDQAELTTKASGLINASVDKIRARQQELGSAPSVPLEDGSVSTNPRDFSKVFGADMEKLYSETVAQADKENPLLGKYVATHLQPIVKESNSAFSNSMTKRWTEQQQFDVLDQVDQYRKNAIAAGDIPGNNPGAFLAQAKQLISSNVGIAFTAEQGAALLKKTTDSVQYERTLQVAKESQFSGAETGRWLDMRAEGRTPEFAKGLPEETLQKIDSEVRTSFEYQSKVQDRQEKRSLADQEIRFGKTRMDLETGIIQGTIHEEDLPQFTAQVKPDDYHLLVTLAHSRELEEIRGEHIKTDPVVASGLLSRLSSANPKVVAGVSESEIQKLIKDQKLDWSTSASIIKYRRERLDHFKNEAETLYDKTAQNGEELIQTLFRTTGLLDIDKQSNQAMADALFEYRGRWRDQRGKPDQDPLAWVYEITQRHEKPILDRNLSDTFRRIQGLKPELQKPEKATKAFHEGQVTEAEYKQALALHQRMKDMERIQQSLSATTGTSGKVQER